MPKAKKPTLAQDPKKPIKPVKPKKTRPPPYRDNIVGRPPDYKHEFCEKLVAHMAQGFTFNSFGAVVGCARSTLNLWQVHHKAFSDAHCRGIEALELNIVARGWAIAEGQLTRTYKKTFIIEGVPVEHEVTEPAIGNSGAFMAIAKNALGWSDKKEVTHSGPDGGPIKSEKVTLSYEQKLDRLATLRRQREAAGK